MQIGLGLDAAFERACLSGPSQSNIRQIHRNGDLAVVEVDEAYHDGSVWKTAFILELRDGLIASLIGYFGVPFPAPAWRIPYTVTTPRS